ncbi:hypothetical protein ID858_02200 [Xenorhabdus sp. DI]|uniref:hypothetical protein n=1 Tax=Xenorhabdus doucetiae TaxID=351671 RepID=UPI0019C891F0|nr:MULTISPECIES: hypothetical protein [unclassified Xenorhabdus]MBD2785033.1 hypothetical protein [Xenorhabdus sp. 3]MBD2787325.1 hypothetical protein [Xenorhabdus sp. DI]
MNNENFEHLLNTGKLRPTSEIFLSPTQSFSESYNGILVRFDLKSGTTKSLEQIGVKDSSRLTRKEFPDMPPISKGWKENYAYFKAEGEQINIGLGKSKALDIFNDNMVNFEKIKEIKNVK